jgi:hypothetical protein
MMRPDDDTKRKQTTLSVSIGSTLMIFLNDGIGGALRDRNDYSRSEKHRCRCPPHEIHLETDAVHQLLAQFEVFLGRHSSRRSCKLPAAAPHLAS